MGDKTENDKVERLKDFHVLDGVNIVLRHKVIVLFVFFLISFVGILVSISLPKTYSASVKFHISSDIENISAENLQKDELDAIKSTAILRQVITELNLIKYFSEHKVPSLQKNICQRLNLNEKEINFWFSGKFFNNKFQKELLPEKDLTIEEIKENEMVNAINRLQSMIYTTSIKNSSTSIITVNSVEDYAIGVKIANALINVYEKSKLNDKITFLNRGILAIERKIKIQENATKEILRQLADFRHSNKEEIFSMNYLININPTEIEKTKSSLNAANMEMLLAKKMITNINAMSNAEFEESFSVNDESPFNCLKLKNELNQAILDYELVKFDSPENEKNEKRAKLKIDELRKQLDGRLVGIKKNYFLKYELLEVKVTELQKKLDELIDKSIGEKSKKIALFNDIINQLLESEKSVNKLKEKLNTERLNQELPSSGIKIYNLAVEPENETESSMFKRIIFSILSGIFISLGIALLIEFLSTSIRNVAQIEMQTHEQVLASIPSEFPLFSQHKRVKKKFYEIFRILWTNVVFLKKNIAPNSKTITITSSRNREGKSSTIANLAYTAAKTGEKILIIDADLHRPTQHKIAGLKNSKTGLIDLLEKNATIDDCITPSPNIENLKYLFAGENYKNNSGIINSERIKEILKETKTQFDHIFIDSPPILGVNYAATLINAADLTIVVVQYNSISKKTLRHTIKIVKNSEGKIAGIIFNKVKNNRFSKIPLV